jgi:hypothetical protein
VENLRRLEVVQQQKNYQLCIPIVLNVKQLGCLPMFGLTKKCQALPTIGWNQRVPYEDVSDVNGGMVKFVVTTAKDGFASVL